MSIEGLSEEDLAMLTEEERAGLLDDEDEGDEGNGTDGDDQDNDDADNDDTGADGEADNKGDENGADGDDSQDAGADSNTQGDGKDGESEGKLDDPIKPTPLFKAELPADIEAKRTALDTQEDDLVKKFDEGDITFAEYNKELRSLNRERADLDRAELKAELAQEAQQSQVEQTWQVTANAFVAEHPLISKNETMWSSFDAVVRRVTAETMQKGEQPGRRDLEKAYKQWTEDLGIAETAQKQEQKPQPKQKKQNVVPPNLGKVPAATANDTDDGKFAHLDRLAESDPLAFEAALAKMSEAQRDEYMQAG